jgi:protein TonB
MGEPRLLRRVEPDYPTEAARRGVEGYVDVRFIVDPDGNVSNLSVIGSNPPELFDRSALAAVRRWKYDPKKINGAPVASRQQVRVQFKLVH